MTVLHYARWRILYTLYWKVDALGWVGGTYSPRFNNWLHDRMDLLGIKMEFLIPERPSSEGPSR